MCIQIIERFAVCGCIYHKHAVDPCPAANQRGHGITIRQVQVGYACSLHSIRGAQPSAGSSRYPDSGYSSGGYQPSNSGYRR